MGIQRDHEVGDLMKMRAKNWEVDAGNGHGVGGGNRKQTLSRKR